MRRRQLPLLAAPLCLPAVQSRAQGAWPTRPVRIVVSFPPGGSSDITARVMAEHYSAAMNQRFVVDNRPGAGGTLSALHVAQQPADGYTLFLSNSAPITTSPPLYPQAGYDPIRSFTHVTYIGAAPVAIVTNPRFIPATDLPSLVAWMKAQPSPASFGSSGTGSVGHILGEMFQRAAGVQLTHVPYRGSAPLLPDLLNGQVPLAFDTMPQYVEHFAANRLRGIAISAPQRNPMAPNVPTTTEGGYPTLIALNWVGISGPAGLPPAVVEKLNAETQAGLRTEIVQRRLLEHAISPTPLGPVEFTAFAQRDVNEIGGMIRALGITAG
ncbi:tripartite tricarboxylate transporter substrate binding protein [Roseococcus sp. SDR]|uniref:Bug family tripartite tricarboxylate transporter substrate binding protein n=1 Tax=Roseococcus sp. SDR TaxID=2835532 RepID=UPI001BD0B150|nr:tripartite tricarboxylate transporter substrate binding protein [Roseococcus sp. SDR]MBS7789634.1 tripartite tricarboxylate transporter substrate binding protein [Roseococcus sp. SDR]MBV1844948.1 tripartite tricarboxylate transporter substrate binding protein [Roseococcus sp. SDR]